MGFFGWMAIGDTIVHWSGLPFATSSSWPSFSLVRYLKLAHYKNVRTGTSLLYLLDWDSKHFNWNVTEWKATQSSMSVFNGKLSKVLKFSSSETQGLLVGTMRYFLRESLFQELKHSALETNFRAENIESSQLVAPGSPRMPSPKTLTLSWSFISQTNRKQPYSLPVLSRFCNGLWSNGASSQSHGLLGISIR